MSQTLAIKQEFNQFYAVVTGLASAPMPFRKCVKIVLKIKQQNPEWQPY